MVPVIETWFPKSIYIIDNVCMDQLNKFESEIKNNKIQTKRTQTLNVDSTHQCDRELHKKLEFLELIKSIEHHSRLFLQHFGYHEQYAKSCTIANMWYNISSKGDFLFPHTHPGSILSGVFYVKSSKNNKIIFYNDDNNTYEPPSTITNLSMSTCEYSCVPGRLLLFRSNFIHGTPKQLDKGEKIAISFNINKD
jgi:uncharacterized protein (TIGR02466 family)